MAVTSRYVRTPLIGLGTQYGTARATEIIRTAVKNGVIATQDYEMRGDDRLDTLAGRILGDSRYWWVLAACSDIGWGLQCPPGTIIKLPLLSDILNLVG